jgi:hypothetical protein
VNAEHGCFLLGAYCDPQDATALLACISSANAASVLERWGEAREAFLTTPSPPAPIASRLSDDRCCQVEELLSRPLFKKSLDGRRWRIAEVTIDALIVQQPIVSAHRTSLFSSRISDDLVATMFPTETSMEVAVDTSKAPAIGLVSSRGELGVSAAFVKRDAASGALEISFRVEPRPNYVSILDCNGSLIVRNGHHRLLAALQMGIKKAPAVVVEGALDLAPSGKWNRFPREVVTGSCPPRLYHFLDSSRSCLDLPLWPRRFVTTFLTEQWSFFIDKPDAGQDGEPQR